MAREMKSQAEINEAAARVKAGTEPRKTRPGGDKGTGSDVGNETKGDMVGAFSGSSLGDAVKELAREHPQRYDDRGPHHSDSSHIRHQPMKLR